MKKTLVAALAAVLAACSGGGGSGIDPTKVTFEYPPADQATVPAIGSSEEVAADTAAATFAVVSDAATSMDEATAASHFQTLAQLPDTLVSQVAGEANSASVSKMSAAKTRRTADVARKALRVGAGLARPAFDDNGCVSVTASKITYDNCATTYEETGYSARYAVNGSMTRTFTDTLATLAWSLTITDNETWVDGSDSGSFTVTMKMTGDIAQTASTIIGSARSDLSVVDVWNGQRATVGVSHLADYDIAYSGACYTGGTLELRRVYTDRDGMPPVFLPDVGVKFFFGDCNQVKVAWNVATAPDAPTTTMSCRWNDPGSTYDMGMCSEMTGPFTADVRSWLAGACGDEGGTFANAACSTTGMVPGSCYYDAEATSPSAWFTSRDYFVASDWSSDDAAWYCADMGGVWQAAQ